MVWYSAVNVTISSWSLWGDPCPGTPWCSGKKLNKSIFAHGPRRTVGAYTACSVIITRQLLTVTSKQCGIIPTEQKAEPSKGWKSTPEDTHKTSSEFRITLTQLVSRLGLPFILVFLHLRSGLAQTWNQHFTGSCRAQREPLMAAVMSSCSQT